MFSFCAPYVQLLTGKPCTGCRMTRDSHSPPGQECLGIRTHQRGVALGLQAQQPAPLGCAAIPNVGVPMYLPEEKDKERKRGEKKSPQGCWRRFPLEM